MRWSGLGFAPHWLYRLENILNFSDCLCPHLLKENNGLMSLKFYL